MHSISLTKKACWRNFMLFSEGIWLHNNEIPIPKLGFHCLQKTAAYWFISNLTGSKTLKYDHITIFKFFSQTGKPYNIDTTKVSSMTFTFNCAYTWPSYKNKYTVCEPIIPEDTGAIIYSQNVDNFSSVWSMVLSHMNDT